MMKQIANEEYLLDKARLLETKNFKPGADGMSASGAVTWVDINGKRLCRELNKGYYEPMPAVAFTSAKKNGGYRRLAKLTAIDSVVQYAVADAIAEICEAEFSPKSFAYRKGRGVGEAVELYCINARNYRLAAKIDPVACFDNIDYGVLEEAVADAVQDGKVTSLIMKFARMPYIENGVAVQPEKGILQGAPLSPVLCNIYLNRLDAYLEENNIEFIRYADDIVIFANSLNEIRKSADKIRRFLSEKLKLNINEKKYKIDSPLKIKYLGFRFEADKKGIIAVEANAQPKTFYRLWHESELYSSRKARDILTDGILRQKDYSLLFENDNGGCNIPVETVDVINVYSDVVLDSGFFKKASKSGIEVNIFDKSGNMLGTFTPFSSLKSPRVTHQQLNAYFDSERRLAIAKQFVLGSVHNFRLNIRYYNKRNPSSFFDDAVRHSYIIAQQIKEAESYDSLLLLEAKARELYYSCFDKFIDNEDFCFGKRTRRPPRNEFNAMLSFGNCVLYNLIATEINKSPLDIRVGFLHATNNRKTSLNLDIAELFKPLIVDRTVLYLINRNMIKREHFVREESGAVLLTETGKRIFIKALYDKLDTVITEKDKKLNYRQVIKAEVYKLTLCFKSDKPYSSFRQVR